MTLSIANSEAVTCADAVADSVDAGAGAGVCKIYSGTVPARVSDTNTGTLLATITLIDPAFGAAVDVPGSNLARVTLDVSTPPTVAASATGTASFFRIEDSNGVVRVQGTAGVAAEDAILNSASIQSGADVTITSMTMDFGEGG